jgi:hypothetical protein
MTFIPRMNDKVVCHFRRNNPYRTYTSLAVRPIGCTTNIWGHPVYFLSNKQLRWSIHSAFSSQKYIKWQWAKIVSNISFDDESLLLCSTPTLYDIHNCDSFHSIRHLNLRVVLLVLSGIQRTCNTAAHHLKFRHIGCALTFSVGLVSGFLNTVCSSVGPQRYTQQAAHMYRPNKLYVGRVYY